ncbi:hypothetical protein CONPUDRAFT_55737 [Coniophora puteana RWD-64-598 SS2]|uniref:Dopa 4,5-dioxygenase n=1 Tax=Coniophora puteana (strain RWD-64-598) TaxID=741705 RepID=A0A5M3MRK4_CONPW|nr:uncharacterized protein CONPUDRAFT_55737 [Coniophora puteana RWD-64-598 SS2]EIW81181.1 hypothetical protein CONPUDRAFT_55737 [Coniophora puteana RWD-64-598 SS2]
MFQPLENTPGPRSKAYDEFPEGFEHPKSGFDFHIYYIQKNPAAVKYATELHGRIRKEFPELKIFAMNDGPVGPHPTASFEVDTTTPHETGAFFSWLAVNRGPCDVLVHPNTNDTYRDHTELATWMGRQWPIYDDLLRGN